MIRKNIEQQLTSIHKKLVKSIKDPIVEALVRDKAIITGGSITSMLLNEEVNDFDVYFSDKNTTIAVANYYVKRWNEVSRSKCVDPTVVIEGDRVRIHIQSLGVVGDTEDQKEPLNEDDNENTFSNRIKKPVESSDDKKSKREDLDPIYLSDNAITLMGGVQLIIRFYGSPDTIHNNYDFIHCTNYWTPGEGLVLKADALEATLAKQLVYSGSKYPLCSIIRTRKFIRRGWSINAGQYLKMCFQLNALNLKDVNILKDQLIGVDALYFNQLIQQCEIDTKAGVEIDNLYISNLVDKIFG
jgi:hypothetical protein